MLSQTDSAILYHCLMELIGEIDADTSIISNLAYSDQVSEPLSDLSYMIVQIRRGEGDMDGEGVANYMRKAMSLGWTEDRFVRLVTTLDESFKAAE